MKSQEILSKYLEFYKKRGHKQIPNASLIPENDPTLLYVNSGMFPLVPYLSGEPHPLGRRLVNVQRALRFFEDLDNVGETNRHTTAFHMIGNWSLGDYFKAEQLPWAYEFFVEVLGLDINKMYASVFEGDKYASKDEESIEIIKKIFKKYGVEAKEGERIFAYGREDNWWQRGEAISELGGPDSEIFYYIGPKGNGLGKDPAKNQDEFLEIGNSVFMQYKKTPEGWEEISQKNVDFGGGLERIALIAQGKTDIFETDNFWPIIQKIEKIVGKKYGADPKETKAMRILSDHMRASVFLAMDGVVPSNKDQGYILRRLLRLMVRAGKKLGWEKDISVSLVGTVTKMFIWLYPELPGKRDQIESLFAEEEKKFRLTLDKGLREIEKVEKIDGKKAFDLYQTYGFPFEMTAQILEERGEKIDRKDFQREFEKHQKLSRTASAGKFKGGLADASEAVTKLHTATHLLHESLRRVLGEHVQQKGSNITAERLRFDFSHPEKLTDGQIKKVEDMVNEQISRNLIVKQETMNVKQALDSGALGFFGERYQEKVKVYSIGPSTRNTRSGSPFSMEICGGPHVEATGEIGRVRITKEESAGAGVRRIYASLAAQ